MLKTFALTFCLLSSCVSTQGSINLGGLSLDDPLELAPEWEAQRAGGPSFSDSLLHFVINESPISIVVGYGPVEPSHVESELPVTARGHRAEARPTLGFSVSF